MNHRTNDNTMKENLSNNEARKSVDSIDWLATLDKITMEIRDDAEDAICGTHPDEGRAMLETIERVRIAMGANKPW